MCEVFPHPLFVNPQSVCVCLCVYIFIHACCKDSILAQQSHDSLFRLVAGALCDEIQITVGRQMQQRGEHRFNKGRLFGCVVEREDDL